MDAVLESLQVLEEHGYLDIHKTFGQGILGMSAFTVTILGLDEYARAFVPNYDEIVERVVIQLVNVTSRDTDGAIAKEIDAKRLLVEHVLDVLQARGLVRREDGSRENRRSAFPNCSARQIREFPPRRSRRSWSSFPTVPATWRDLQKRAPSRAIQRSL